jgi:hypothetical protein
MILNKKDNGLLYEIHSHILKNSWYKQPELAISAALCTMSVIVDRKITFEGNCANLYCLNISPSASGKDAPQQTAKNILLQSGMANKVGCGNYVSEAALMDMLEFKDIRLDCIDEASSLLGVASNGTAAYNAGIGDTLCELFTTSNGHFAGRALAGGKTKGACARPYVTILMSTTPRGFEESMNIRSVEKGLMGRCLLFFGDPDADGDRIKEVFNINDSVKTALQAIHMYKPMPDSDFVETRKLSDTHSHSILIAETETEEVEKYADTLFRKYHDIKSLEDINSPLRAIIGRGYQMCCKIALLNSISRTYTITPAKVNMVDFRFAESIVDKNIENFRHAIGTMIFENKSDEQYVKIRTYIQRKINATLSEITNAVRGVRKQQRAEILGDLKEARLVREDVKKVDKKGNLEITYTWIGENE